MENLLARLLARSKSLKNSGMRFSQTFVSNSINTFQSNLAISQIIETLFKSVNSPVYAMNGLSNANSQSTLMPFNLDVNAEPDMSYADIFVREKTQTKKPLNVMMMGLRGFPNVQGGVEKHAENLAPLLVSLGCNVEVIVRSPYHQGSEGKEWGGIKFTSIWAPKQKGLEAILHSFLGVLYAAVKRPDILHIHAIGPALMTPLARLLGLRVVVTHHGADYERQKWGFFARKILQLGEWMGMRFSNGRIVVSKVIRDLVVRKHGVYSAYISNGVVMPTEPASESFIQSFGIEKNKYILMVSRFVPEKRHLDLINAFNLANLSDVKLVLVGESDHPDQYVVNVKNEAAKNKNIVLTGFQTGETLASLYQHAAVFVLPSSHEGLSISLLESLSYGLPTIASRIPANLEVGLSQACYFELGNVPQLADLLAYKMQLSHQSVDERATILNWVSDEFNWHKIAMKTLREYQSATY